MLKRMRLAALGLTLTLIGSTLLPNSAEARGGHKGKWKEMSAELNLTAEQKAKMQEINKGRREELAPKRKAMKEARENLETSLKSAESTDVVKQKFSELQKAQSEFAVARFNRVLAVREVLTPEQRAKFKGMKFGGGRHHGAADEDDGED
jgi:Spy/CpxP family protein refolding chaperone